MRDDSQPRTFRAFISYRHADNAVEGRRWAHWLQNELERYQVPPDLIGRPNSSGKPVPENLYPIFRDEEEMRAGRDLNELITDGLARSDWLIVLCSPRSAASRYVRREILQFKLQGKSARILPVIIEGEPGACFPRTLRQGVPVENKTDARGRAVIDWRGKPELLAADLRPAGTSEQGYTSAGAYRAELERRNALLPQPQRMTTKALRDAEERYAHQLDQQKLKIVSGLLGVDLGELTKRDAAARARRLKRLLILSTTVLLIVLGLAVAALYQWIVASSNLAASRYTLSNGESEERSNPAGALLLASGAVEAVPRVDPLLDVYARRAEQLAFASPRQMKVADRAQLAVLSPGFDKVATLDAGRVRITDLRSGQSVHVPSLTESQATVAPFTIPAFSLDGSHFVAGVNERSARAWRLRDGRSVPVETPHVVVRGTLQSRFYFSPNGRSALGWVGVETGDEDGQHVDAAWDTESGAAASTAPLGDVFRFSELAWSRNPARNWGVVLLEKRRLQIVDVSTGEPVSPEFGPSEAEAEVVSLALSADAEWLVTVTRTAQKNSYELRLWSARAGTAADADPMLSSEPLRIQDVSADGKRVLAVPDRGRDPTPLQLWEFGRRSYPRPYRELGTVPSPLTFWAGIWGQSRLAAFCGETGLVAAVSAAPDAWTGSGPRVVSAFSIRLWQAEIAQEVSYSIRSEGGLVAWRVSPDGRAIATVTADGVVTIRDLFWHEPAAPAVAAPASAALKADRVWFAPGGTSAISATLEGIVLVGGMPTSEGTPKLRVQHWRLPGLTPLWKQPVELPGEPMQLASAKVAFRPGGDRIAIGTTDVRLFDSDSGAVRGTPLVVNGRLRGVTFTGDGQHIVIASEAANEMGRTFFRIEQRTLDSRQEVKGAGVEWLLHGEGPLQRGFAGFAADARHFMRVSARDDFTGDWETVERLELLDLEQSRALHIAFTRQSPAPAALTAAVIQSASRFERVSSDEIIASLPAARIRIRAVPAGATLEHVESRRSIIAPATRVDARLMPVLSADGNWIGTSPPGRREVRVWSAFTGMPSSQPLILRTELVAMTFDTDAQHLWLAGRDGGPQAAYVGAKDLGKARWLKPAGEALTGMQLTGQGVGVAWLDGRQRQAALEELRRSLSAEAAKGDPRAARMQERLNSIFRIK